MVSMVTSFIFETTAVKFAYTGKIYREICIQRNITEMFRELIKLAKIKNCQF